MTDRYATWSVNVSTLHGCQPSLSQPSQPSLPINQSRSGTALTVLTTLAGDPTATENGGISLVTTAPAPIVHPFPMVTPARRTTFPPIQQSFPIVTGWAYSILSRRDCTSVSCVAAKMLTEGPIMTRWPIVTRAQSRIVRLAPARYVRAVHILYILCSHM